MFYAALSRFEFDAAVLFRVFREYKTNGVLLCFSCDMLKKLTKLLLNDTSFALSKNSNSVGKSNKNAPLITSNLTLNIFGTESISTNKSISFVWPLFHKTLSVEAGHWIDTPAMSEGLQYQTYVTTAAVSGSID